MTLRSYKGKSPRLGSGVYVDVSAQLVGDIQLAEEVSVWPLVAARGDVNRITIGARTNIQDGSVLHVTRRTAALPEGHPLVIGEEVTIGHKVMLHGCRLGNRILVGMGAIILDGAEVEDEVMIAAGALVAPGKRLESGYLYIGAPARQARALTDEERHFLRQSADNYVRLKNDYLAELAN